MRYTIIASVILFSGALATPALSARDSGHGCGVFDSDDKVCNQYCLNDITKVCKDGTVLKPWKGQCGGPLKTVCQCIYNASCSDEPTETSESTPPPTGSATPTVKTTPTASATPSRSISIAPSNTPPRSSSTITA